MKTAFGIVAILLASVACLLLNLLPGSWEDDVAASMPAVRLVQLNPEIKPMDARQAGWLVATNVTGVAGARTDREVVEAYLKASGIKIPGVLWSADRHGKLYVAHFEDHARSYIYYFDGISGRRDVVVDGEVGFGMPKFFQSAIGMGVVIDGPRHQLYYYDFEGKKLRALSPGHSARVSPDRKKLAFLVSDRSAGGPVGFYNLRVWNETGKGAADNVLSLNSGDFDSGRMFDFWWSEDSAAICVRGEAMGFYKGKGQTVDHVKLVIYPETKQYYGTVVPAYVARR